MTMRSGVRKGEVEPTFNSVLGIFEAKLFYGKGIVKFYEDMTSF
jgi:hypothetical protein